MFCCIWAIGSEWPMPTRSLLLVCVGSKAASGRDPGIALIFCPASLERGKLTIPLQEPWSLPSSKNFCSAFYQNSQIFLFPKNPQLCQQLHQVAGKKLKTEGICFQRTATRLKPDAYTVSSIWAALVVVWPQFWQMPICCLQRITSAVSICYWLSGSKAVPRLPAAFLWSPKYSDLLIGDEVELVLRALLLWDEECDKSFSTRSQHFSLWILSRMIYSSFKCSPPRKTERLKTERIYFRAI